MLNSQGDVIGLLDGNANQVVSYTYDAWGNILSSQCNCSYESNLDQINPLRYRGYYYDTETGWYYLQSRYYDPAVKRFINADDQIDKDANFIGCNLFCYCANNSVSSRDENGRGRLGAFIKRTVKRTIKRLFRKRITPAVRRLKSGLKKMFKQGTYSTGTVLSASCGGEVTVSKGIVVDVEGNVGAIYSAGGGGGMFSASICKYHTITDAPTIEDLSGWSEQVGGSGGNT